MAIVDDTAPPRKEPSFILQMALLAALTALAAGIGWGSGLYLSGNAPAEQPAGHTPRSPAQETSLAEAQEQMGVVYLEPITTNLAGPGGNWVRIELALVFEGPSDLLTAQTVHQDILAYMRTVKMHQVEGASGFQHLRSDLEERAAIRSGGKVSGILIRTLLFE